MSGWEVGDLALCVRGGHISGPPTDRTFPRAGVIGRVEKAVTYGSDDVWLLVKDLPDNIDSDGFNWGPFWHASRFVKVTPPAADEFDRETLALMNGVHSKPSVTA